MWIVPKVSKLKSVHPSCMTSSKFKSRVGGREYAFIYQKNALFPQSFFKRLWSGTIDTQVISMIDCSECHEGLRSAKIGWRIAVNFYNTLNNLEG